MSDTNLMPILLQLKEIQKSINTCVFALSIIASLLAYLAFFKG